MSETPQMETFRIPGTGLAPSRIGLGTWAIGGWQWGGTDEAESIRTIHAALDRGITLIDTAPVYGFGRSEEIVGKALAAGGRRAGVVLATKVALDWKGEQPFRNGSRGRILKEIDDSLRRLRTERSTFIKSIGPIRTRQLRKLPAPCPSCCAPARSGRSASAISARRR